MKANLSSLKRRLVNLINPVFVYNESIWYSIRKIKKNPLNYLENQAGGWWGNSRSWPSDMTIRLLIKLSPRCMYPRDTGQPPKKSNHRYAYLVNCLESKHSNDHRSVERYRAKDIVFLSKEWVVSLRRK